MKNGRRGFYERVVKLTTPPPPFDVGKIFGSIVGAPRTRVRLHRRTPKAQLGFKSSKVGGAFLWPAGKPWPKCGEHKADYAAVLQLRSKEFPELPCPAGMETFQLLWCPNDHPEMQSWPAVEVYWHNCEQPTLQEVRPSQFEKFEKDYLPQECELNPERIEEFPSEFSLREEDFQRMNEISEEAAELYQDSLSVAPGFKVGGFPNWCQDPQIPRCQCGGLMSYVLTVDSNEFDGGTVDRWLSVEEREFWSAPYEKRIQVQSAVGIMLGDMGEMNLFACMQCSPWRYKAVFQCS
jgi:hypothetical protein